MSIWNLIVPFAVCSVLCGALIFLNQRLGIGRDKSTGVQKFHVNATSRLGGVALFMGLIFTVGWANSNGSISSTTHNFLNLFILSSIPVFLAGILEDITHKIAPASRLMLALISSTLAYLLLEVKVTRTDVWVVDWLLQWPIFIYLFTLLVISGFTHATNIIDGFNGLASGQILLMLGSLSYLNYTTHQLDLFFLSTSLFFITIGFFVWNWPFGKIFLGDGGAYFLGFCVVFLGLLLVYRSAQVSPFAPIMLGIYPLVEVIFSMYRRLVIRGHSVTRADALHLHSLIFRRVLKNRTSSFNPQLMNSKVALFFWVVTFIISCITIIYYKESNVLFGLFFIFIFFYIWLFTQLVRFKTPRWIFYCL